MENTVALCAGIQPDAARFFIPVELDRTRVLAFDSAATFLIFQKFGENFIHELYEADPNAPAPVKGRGQKLRLRSREAFEFFLWAGLQRDAKAAGEILTLEAVADQIVPTTINDLFSALLVALAATRRPVNKAQATPKNA
jgi:hypothetical protein